MAAVLLLLLAGPYGALARPHHVYARPGDPLRFVFEVGQGGSMGILAEGPLRARCFLIGLYERDLTLGAPGEPGHPADPADLAHRLDLSPAELPKDLIAIWRTGTIDWPVFEPGSHVAIDGAGAIGPHRLVGHEAARWFVLSSGRGYLLIFHYCPGYTRVLRIGAATDEFVIRPGAGLIEMIKHPRVRPSDIGRHLKQIDQGIPIDWSELRGYYE